MENETMRNYEEMLSYLRDKFTVVCGVPSRYLSNEIKHPTIIK